MRTDLAGIQSWMQAIIVSDPDSEIPEQEARELVLPSKTLSPMERVDIYRSMYLSRMVEALEIDYPGLAQYLGVEGFYNLVARFVDAYPSRSYTLNRLGDRLPDFIATLSDVKRKDFLHDLARLESASNVAFDAEETPPLTAGAIAAVPQEAWENARMKPIAALHLLEFQYPVSEYLGSVLDEAPPPNTKRKRTWVAAYRKDYGLRRLDLTLPEYELLCDLVNQKTVGEAIITACTKKGKARAKEEDLFKWFQTWMAQGLFHKVLFM
jgi:hypothetical protein